MKFVFSFVIALLSVCLLSIASAAPVQAHSGRNPAGNNGFIKVNEEKITDHIPNNDPHVACTFKVDFYNYDKGAHYAEVKFALQAPTNSAAHELTVASGNLKPFIGGDKADGGDDLDASIAYILKFKGAPATQGYHVKVTIHADGSKGNDVKHKVFWVSPCETPKPPVVTPPTKPTKPDCEKPEEPPVTPPQPPQPPKPEPPKPTPTPPAPQPAPQVSQQPQILAASTKAPAELPSTGSQMNPWLILIPAALTYVVLYRRQKRLAATAAE